MKKDSFVELTTEGRVAVHVTADGPILHYTYSDQDNNIPEGMRKVSYLEPLEEAGFTIDPEQSKVGTGPISEQVDLGSAKLQYHWDDKISHVRTGGNTMTIDLDENKIAFGLLSKEEQEHLSSWQHGLLVLRSSIVGRPVWCRADPKSKLSTTSVYRTVPAPVEPERETIWIAYDDAYGTFLTKSRHGARRRLKTARGFAFCVEFDDETGDNPTITKEVFDE